MKPKNFLISLLAIIVVAILPHSGIIPFPFAYTIPILLVVWFCLKYFGEDFSRIGFDLKLFNFKSVLVGSLVAILFFSFSQLILFPALELFISFDEVNVDLYNKLKGNTGFYIFILIMGWVVGGLYEEIVFHGFIFSRLEKMIPGKYATQFSYLCTSIIFGVYHIQLGGADTINALIIGAGYLGLMLHYKRNLWYAIFCHGTYNTLAITSLYLGYL